MSMSAPFAFDLSPGLLVPVSWAPLLLASFVVLVAVYLRFRPANVPASLPGPTPRLPLFGVALTADYDWPRWPTKCLQLSRRYGFRTWGGPTLNVGFGPAFFVVLSEENVRHILRDRFDNYAKGGPATGCLRELFGDVLFGADGERWKVHRNAAAPQFSAEAAKASFGAVSRKVNEVCEVLDGVARKNGVGGGASGSTVDIQDIFMRMTMDVAIEISLGIKVDSLEDGGKHKQFLEALDELALLSHARFEDLLYQVKQRFCLTEREKKIHQCAAVVNEFADGLVRQILQQQKPAQNGGDNVLARFVSLSTEADRRPPTEIELRNMVMNVVFAGRGTTACALTWTFYELTRHPEELGKLLEEIEGVCGTGPGADHSYEAMGKLDYTHAVLMEALRLHPPATDSWRMAKKDDVLPDGTSIPAGSCVMYSPYTMGHSEAIWGDDAEEFRPGRFLDRPQPSAYKFLAFNAGPRICPGRCLALLEMKLVLARLLAAFHFEDTSRHSGDYTWALVLAMKGGFHVSLKKRL